MSFCMRGIILGAIVLSAADCLALSEEEYLKYIESETATLSEPARPMLPNGAAKVKVNKKAGELSQPEFESLLRMKQRGTYSIYESLMEKDKAEVYKAFHSGASMRTVRRMIIDRNKCVFDLVIDFGTSQSPKSTRPLTTYLCPRRPAHQALRNNFASSLLLRTWCLGKNKLPQIRC